MFITLVEEKTSKSFLRRISGGLSKYFVTAKSYSTEEINEYLGITAIASDKSNISYTICAQYAKSSTSKNPLVEIKWNNEEEKTCIQIYINTVNPKCATMQEMFALCSYSDNVGIYKAEKNSSFQELKNCINNAVRKGICKDIINYRGFCNQKLNWDSIVNELKDIYLEVAAYEQYQQCLKLMDLFDYYAMVQE